MRRSLAISFVVSAVLVGLAAPVSAAGPTGTYIVTLREGAAAAATASAHGRAYGLAIEHVYGHALNGYAATMNSRAAAALARDSSVRSVIADRTVSIDVQPLPTGIDRIDAELNPTAAIDGDDTRVDVDVAVIDTGIDLDHPDLDVEGGTNCVKGKPTLDDGNGHGTHVAGTIAALDNDFGVVGVAPGARLWAVRVLNNNGSGTWASVICGVDWVTANAGMIEVANMSLGGTGDDSGGCNDGGLHEAICKSVAAGVTYAVAAGNSADDAKNHVPAAYDEVITVSALADFNGAPGGGAPATCRSDVDDTFANFSNFGADIDLIAPGVCIRSTWKGGGYNTISGTSMASPHVAGAAALYKAGNPAASPAAVVGALQAAGNYGWDTTTDPDDTDDILANVAGF